MLSLLCTILENQIYQRFFNPIIRILSNNNLTRLCTARTKKPSLQCPSLRRTQILSRNVYLAIVTSCDSNRWEARVWFQLRFNSLHSHVLLVAAPHCWSTLRRQIPTTLSLSLSPLARSTLSQTYRKPAASIA